MRINIVKYKEGFLIVIKIIIKGVSITNVSVKLRSKTIIMIKMLNRKWNSCSTSFSGRRVKFEDFLEFYMTLQTIYFAQTIR